jgi:hypothetical protein
MIISYKDVLAMIFSPSFFSFAHWLAFSNIVHRYFYLMMLMLMGLKNELRSSSVTIRSESSSIQRLSALEMSRIPVVSKGWPRVEMYSTQLGSFKCFSTMAVEDVQNQTEISKGMNSDWPISLWTK